MFKKTTGEIVTEQGFGYVLVYRQYSNWSVSAMYETPERAMTHSRVFLENDEIIHPNTGEVLVKDSKGHIDKVLMIKVDLSTGVKLK